MVKKICRAKSSGSKRKRTVILMFKNTETRTIIEKTTIGSAARATAIRIFDALGEAEAEIHNTSIEQVHFHEVGSVDAMVDIVCAAVGAESLAVEEWVCSPLNVAS